MTNLAKLLRREIVTLDEGITLGRAHDVLIDPEEHRVAVIVLTAGAAPELAVIVHSDAVESFDRDTLGIRSLTALRLAAHDDRVRELLRSGWKFRGHPVLSGSGTRIGRIRNVAVDEHGRVVEYRVRRGLLGFLRPARKITPGDLRTSGGEVAVLHPQSD